MPLFMQNNQISEVYYGADKIAEIYYGSDLVYRSTLPIYDVDLTGYTYTQDTDLNTVLTKYTGTATTITTPHIGA